MVLAPMAGVTNRLSVASAVNMAAAQSEVVTARALVERRPSHALWA